MYISYLSFATILSFATSYPLPCHPPVGYMISKLEAVDWSVQPVFTILYSTDVESLDLSVFTSKKLIFATTNATMSSWNVSIKALYVSPVMSTFSVAIIVPPDLESARNVMKLVTEMDNFYRSERAHLPAVFITWPTMCPGLESKSSAGLKCLLGSDDLGHNASNILPLPGVTSEIYIMMCDNGRDWLLINLYQVGRHKLTFLQQRPWSSLFDTLNSNSNLNGQKLVLVVPDYIKEDFTYKVENGVRTQTSGFVANILGYLTEALNYTPTYILTKGWSGPTGIATHLINGTADFIAAKVTYLPVRRQMFQTITPIYSQGLRAFFRQPPASTVRDIYIKPFNTDVWFALLVMWTLIIASTLFASKMLSSVNCMTESDEEVSEDTFLWALGFSCQQGWFIDPSAVSLRIIFFWGTLLGLIVYVAYGASLVIIFSEIVLPIQSFSDILTSGSLEVTYDPHSISTQYLLNNSELATALQRKKVQFDSITTAVRSVFDSNKALICFPDLFYSIVKNTMFEDNGYVCSTISSLRINQVPLKSGFFFPNGSHYAELFSYKIQHMIETGLLFRYLRHYFLSLQGECDKSLVKTDVGLGLSDVFTAFWVLGVGYITATAIWVVEKIYFIVDPTWRLTFWMHKREAKFWLRTCLAKFPCLQRQ